MKKIKKISLLFLLSAIGYQLSAKTVYAICPICTLAVGAGLGLSRFLGIDDLISGIWVGGLILSSSLWFATWISKKKLRVFSKLENKTLNIISVILMYSLVFIPLWLTGIIGHPFNQIFGIDKLTFGSALGSAVFLLGVWVDKKVRKIKGKQFIQFQKIIFPVGLLLIISLILFLTLR
jgi:hypothetical protein